MRRPTMYLTVLRARTRHASPIGQAALIAEDLADFLTRLNTGDIPELDHAAHRLREATRLVRTQLPAALSVDPHHAATVRYLSRWLRELQ